MWESKPWIQAQLKKLQEYFASLPDGEVLSWLEIEQATGVQCGSSHNTQARELVRRALRKSKRPYLARIGNGIELSSPLNAVDLSESEKRGVWRKVKKAALTTEQLADRHLDDMHIEDKHQLVLNRAILGGMLLANKQSRKFNKKPAPQGGGVAPVLPMPRKKAQ